LSVRLWASLLVVAGLGVGCAKHQPDAAASYRALVEKTARAFSKDPEAAYQGEVAFSKFVLDSMAQGRPFPNQAVLAWTYPQIALAAEYSGRREEAARMFVFAEAYLRRLHPGQPIDRSGQFKTLRDLVVYMNCSAGVRWLK
jgi:hypothetical protein